MRIDGRRWLAAVGERAAHVERGALDREALHRSHLRRGGRKLIDQGAWQIDRQGRDAGLLLGWHDRRRGIRANFLLQGGLLDAVGSVVGGGIRIGAD